MRPLPNEVAHHWLCCAGDSPDCWYLRLIHKPLPSPVLVLFPQTTVTLLSNTLPLVTHTRLSNRRSLDLRGSLYQPFISSIPDLSSLVNRYHNAVLSDRFGGRGCCRLCAPGHVQFRLAQRHSDHLDGLRHHRDHRHELWPNDHELPGSLNRRGHLNHH